MPYVPITTAEIAVGKPVTNPLMTKIKDNFDFFNGAIAPAAGAGRVLNGSFEIDSNSDSIPDNWTFVAGLGGSGALDTVDEQHGAKGFKITRPLGVGNVGGTLTSDYIEATDSRHYWLGWIQYTLSGVGITNKVDVECFNQAQVSIGTISLLNSANNEAVPVNFLRFFKPLAGTRYIKIKLLGGDSTPNVAGNVIFDNVALDPYVPWVSDLDFTLGQAAITSTTYVTLGSTGLTLPYDIAGRFELDFIVEIASDVAGNGITARFAIGADNSNEAYFAAPQGWSTPGGRFLSFPVKLRFNTTGGRTLSVSMQGKVSAAGESGSIRKLFAPATLRLVPEHG